MARDLRACATAGAAAVVADAPGEALGCPLRMDSTAIVFQMRTGNAGRFVDREVGIAVERENDAT